MSGSVIPSIRLQDIDPEKLWFNPGCAMSVYKPHLVQPMLDLLRRHLGDVQYHGVCCHHSPGLPEGAVIINNCAGCDRRFRSLYPGIRTISVWEVLDSLEGVSLPRWEGLEVSVHDSCSFRQKPQVHAAVRGLLGKMGIRIVESRHSGMNSVCCGDTFYSRIPNEQVTAFHQKRAAQMPCGQVVVYCIGCIRAMTAGGKQPLYLPDLVMGLRTEPMADSLDAYHRAVEDYIARH